MMGNEKKSNQLGMPFGTATNRLRKMILFRLLQRLGEDVCFRCGCRIESVDDLSIEHKSPWLDVDMSLFWDLGNVVFSHLRCNSVRGSLGKPSPRRKVGQPGTAWCSKHQSFFPMERFTKNRSRWNGLHDLCKDCRGK